MPYILAALFMWSSLGLVIRLSGLPIHILIFYSCVISSLIFGFMFFSRRYRKEIPGPKSLLYFVILGPLSLINTFSFFYAYKHTSIANAVLTHYTAPIFVAFLAPIFLKEKLTIRIFLSIVVATAGLWIMLGISVKELFGLIMTGDRNTGGIIAGLLSGVAYALLLIIMRVMSMGFHPFIIAFFQNSIIALMLLPFASVKVDLISSLWALAVTGIVHSTIAPVLYYKGLRVVTANKAAILGYLEPVCAIILGVIFLGETISYETVLGGVMILFSGYLTMTGNN